MKRYEEKSREARAKEVVFTRAPRPPFLAPVERRHALTSATIELVVLGILALFLYYLYQLWLPDRVPEQVVYFAILGATVVTVLLFVASLLFFVLPRLLGLRGPPV